MSDLKPRMAVLTRQIADLAVRGGWRRGRHVTEMELVKELGVSRTPIRCAMRALVAAGAVEARPNHGFFLLEDGEALAKLRLEVAPNAEEVLFGLILKDRLSGALPVEVTQAVLAERYSASRAVLEHVLARLADDGLIQRGGGRAWRFVESVNDTAGIRASYDFRALVEPSAILLDDFSPRVDVLRTLHERHMALLADIGDETVPATTRTRRLMRRADVVALDADFHGSIAGFSGNPFVAASVRQQIELRRLLELGTYEEAPRVMTWCNEHIAVIDALLAGDLRTAETALRNHLQRAARDTLEAINQDKRR
jgi:DNA-binding GntR family transcriptional regulator